MPETEYPYVPILSSPPETDAQLIRRFADEARRSAAGRYPMTPGASLSLAEAAMRVLEKDEGSDRTTNREYFTTTT
jgi:hypothetical protein